MGEAAAISPYLASARQATRLAARRQGVERLLAAMRDAERLEQLGLRALARGRRGGALAAAGTLAFGAATVALLTEFWGGSDASDAGLVRAAWSLLGATVAAGGAYFSFGGIERARRRRYAGKRLLLRASRQRARAGENP